MARKAKEKKPKGKVKKESITVIEPTKLEEKKVNKDSPDYKPERHPNGYWKKGFSGNPGGAMNYYRTNSKIREFANAMLTDSFNVAHEILTNEQYDLKPAERIKLILELWNRAEGRVPTQLNIKQESTEVGQMNLLQITSELDNVDMQLKNMGVIDSGEEDTESQTNEEVSQ